MRTNAKLAAFMGWKARFVDEVLGLPAETYYNEEDRQDILSWSEDKAAEVWRRIGMCLDLPGFPAALCPFCWFYEDWCKKCTYGSRHGACGKPDSSYKQITRVLRKLRMIIPRKDFYYELYGALDEAKQPNMASIFEAYKNLIKGG